MASSLQEKTQHTHKYKIHTCIHKSVQDKKLAYHRVAACYVTAMAFNLNVWQKSVAFVQD